MTDTAPPREGLTPCFRAMADFGDRAGAFHDNTICTFKDLDYKYSVVAGYKNGVIVEGHPLNFEVNPIIVELTEIEEIAQLKWEQAQEWVRTGELIDDV